MQLFVKSVPIGDGETRYYVGGCRVSRAMFYILGGSRLECIDPEISDRIRYKLSILI